MSFHDRAAQIVREQGGTVDEYRRSARRHGALAVLLVIAAVAAGYALHWALGGAVGVAAAYKAFQTYSCTAIAARLGEGG